MWGYRAIDIYHTNSGVEFLIASESK